MSTKNLLILIGMDRTCRVSSSFRERDCIWGSFCSHDFCRMFCCKSSTTKWLPTRIQKFKTYEISKCKCQGHSWFGCPNSWEGLVELLLWPKHKRLQNKNMKKSRTTIFGFDNCGKDGTGCPNSWERQVELVTVISRTLSQ